MTNNLNPKRIPYAISDYTRLREEKAYYVDKTHYIPLIEAAPFYLFCIRPRRFGKSLWLTVLRDYYDLNRADDFEFLFGETYIGQNPTSERNSYLTQIGWRNHFTKMGRVSSKIFSFAMNAFLGRIFSKKF